MKRVQERILQDYLGEQPVGTSIIVETGHHKHPFIAHTPTMRVPMPIATTDNVYTGDVGDAAGGPPTQPLGCATDPYGRVSRPRHFNRPR